MRQESFAAAGNGAPLLRHCSHHLKSLHHQHPKVEIPKRHRAGKNDGAISLSHYPPAYPKVCTSSNYTDELNESWSRRHSQVEKGFTPGHRLDHFDCM